MHFIVSARSSVCDAVLDGFDQCGFAAEWAMGRFLKMRVPDVSGCFAAVAPNGGFLLGNCLIAHVPFLSCREMRATPDVREKCYTGAYTNIPRGSTNIFHTGEPSRSGAPGRSTTSIPGTPRFRPDFIGPWVTARDDVMRHVPMSRVSGNAAVRTINCRGSHKNN